MDKNESEHNVSKIGGSVSRNLEIAVVELEQPLLEGGIINIRDLWKLIRRCGMKAGNCAYNNLRGEGLIEIATLGVGRQKDLRVRVDDEHLLSEGRIIRVEGKEGTTSL